jgi:hypothetical protein
MNESQTAAGDKTVVDGEEVTLLRIYPVEPNWQYFEHRTVREVRITLFYRSNSGPHAGQCFEIEDGLAKQQEQDPPELEAVPVDYEVHRVSCASVDALPLVR